MSDWNTDVMSGLNSIVSAGANLAQNIQVSNTQKADRRFMRQENQKNYEHFIENRDWNYQRYLEALEYDSPSAQYQRLLDAGLNPSYYMQQNVGSNAASSYPQTEPFQEDPFGYSPGKYLPERNLALRSLSDNAFALTAQLFEKKKLDNETRKLYRNEDIVNETISNLKKDGKIKDQEAKELQKRIDEIQERVNSLKADVDLKRQQHLIGSFEASRIKDKLDNHYDKLLNDLEFLRDSGDAWKKFGEGSIYRTGIKLMEDAAHNIDSFLEAHKVNRRWRIGRFMPWNNGSESQSSWRNGNQ